MSLPLPDFGLTSWIDFTNSSEVTADAQLRISAVGDSLGLIDDFTQATDANKPLYSRSDNRENLVQGSQGLFNNVTYWTKAAVTVTDNSTTAPDGTSTASTINVTESSAYHHFRTTTAVRPTWISGQEYSMEFRVKAGTHGFVQIYNETNFPANSWTNFDLINGVVGTRGAGVAADKAFIEPLGDGWYKISQRITTTGTAGPSTTYLGAVSSATAAALETWTPPAGALFYVWGAQGRNSLTDPTYLPTTDHPQYAGVIGRSVAVFNGAQWLGTTSTFNDIVTADVKLFYVVAVSHLFDGTVRTLLGQGTPGSGVMTLSSGPRFILRNDDGAADAANNGVNQSVNVPYLIRGRQVGGDIFLGVDSGAGFVEGSAVASGSTASMANIMRIGARNDGSAGFYGKIAAIGTANTGAAKPNMETLLREYFFARSQLRWDPYLADLVLKRQ